MLKKIMSAMIPISMHIFIDWWNEVASKTKIFLSEVMKPLKDKNDGLTDVLLVILAVYLPLFLFVRIIKYLVLPCCKSCCCCGCTRYCLAFLKPLRQSSKQSEGKSHTSSPQQSNKETFENSPEMKRRNSIDLSKEKKDEKSEEKDTPTKDPGDIIDEPAVETELIAKTATIPEAPSKEEEEEEKKDMLVINEGYFQTKKRDSIGGEIVDIMPIHLRQVSEAKTRISGKGSVGHRRTSDWSVVSSSLSLFEDMMQNNTVIEGIRQGTFHQIIKTADIQDLAHFFPIIIPDAMKCVRDEYVKIIMAKATYSLSLRQVIYYFWLSNQHHTLVRRVWAKVILQHSVRLVHPLPKLFGFLLLLFIKKKEKQQQHAVYMHRNSNKDKKHENANSTLSKDDLSLANHEGLIAIFRNIVKNGNSLRPGHRVQLHNGQKNQEISYGQLRSPKRDDKKTEHESSRNESKDSIYFDPIVCHQQISTAVVRKVFRSSACPVWIETYDCDQNVIAQVILKQGDDLRKDAAVMFMFQLFFFIFCYFDKNFI
ncbi:hypothetical protein RFI_02588 [Reticulomyxa filosa]|uniref:Uncharacterized protein n=1 Tax=Reticulomyxa filosa TaxID=46433 RepID=X6P7L1_RETFI|nr:hypothetical protein RFI_02588 [Reticulomyxa filosa]|eukprot:ETO34505.1 hypothetical protein RFI_02588 [Reticulomyxa filosa]